MKFLKEYYKQILFIILLILFLSISVPFLLEYVVYRSQFPSSLDNSDISSFLGNFLGAIIGGGITLITMYVTINETRKDLREEQRIKNRSYIDTFAKESKSGRLVECKDFYKKAKVVIDNDYLIILDRPTVIAENNGLVFVGIQNCGPSIVRDMRVDITNKKGTSKSFFINRILMDELFFIPIVYGKSEDMKCFIEKITLTFKTLSNEVIVVNKNFEKNLRYSEEIKIYDKHKYEYNSQLCRWIDIENLN